MASLIKASLRPEEVLADRSMDIGDTDESLDFPVILKAANFADTHPLDKK